MAGLRRGPGPKAEASVFEGLGNKLDEFLKFNERGILNDAGTVNKETADAKALAEYEALWPVAGPLETEGQEDLDSKFGTGRQTFTQTENEISCLGQGDARRSSKTLSRGLIKMAIAHYHETRIG